MGDVPFWVLPAGTGVDDSLGLAAELEALVKGGDVVLQLTEQAVLRPYVRHLDNEIGVSLIEGNRDQAVAARTERDRRPTLSAVSIFLRARSVFT